MMLVAKLVLEKISLLASKLVQMCLDYLFIIPPI